MASNGTIAHRFANKDFGKNGTLKGSSVSIEGRNYYSYSTVFGQWLDISKNVCLVFNGDTSNTSHRHMLYSHLFPKNVHLFEYEKRGWSGWYGCGLLSHPTTDADFTTERRFILLDFFVDKMYSKFKNITTSEKRGAEEIEFYEWDEFEELCSLYDDISVKKWLKQCNSKQKAAMVKLLAKGERDVETITDAMFGKGAFKKYYDFCDKFRKSDDTKKKMVSLCHRLGMESPYRSEWGCSGKLAQNVYSASEIRKWDAKKRNEVHFANLMQIEYDKHESERLEKRGKSKRNLFKYITGFEATSGEFFRWSPYGYVEQVRNMFNGEVYVIKHKYLFHQWFSESVCVHLDDYIKAEDKHAWLDGFYAEAKEVSENIKAVTMLRSMKVPFDKEEYGEERYRINCNQVYELNEEDRDLVQRYYERQEKHYRDKEARRRAAEIERERRKQEEEREKAYKAQVKQEQINECLERGAEGCRDLWRLHLVDVHESHREFDKIELTGCPKDYDKFFYGGNILLRFNLDKTYVETSKGIRIPIEVCKKFYPIFKKWHENSSSFKAMKIDTKGSGTYTISEYKNDILTAGCHDIAWTEMERMYNEIQGL